jgi:hypothetical protein
VLIDGVHSAFDLQAWCKANARFIIRSTGEDWFQCWRLHFEFAQKTWIRRIHQWCWLDEEYAIK